MRLGACFSIVGLAVAALVACNEAPPAQAVAQSVTVGSAPSGKFGTWDRFRGPKGDGWSTETGINKDWSAKAPRLLWQAELTDDGYAGPASAEGMVFIVDHQGSDDIVRAFNILDGKEVWRTTYPDANQSNYGFSRATPCYEAGKLYVVSRLGKVLCLDAKNGKVLWQRDMVSEMGGQKLTWDYAASPIIHKDRVLVLPGAENGAIVGLDKKTGKTVFTGGAGAASYATPVVATIDGKEQYVLFLAKKLCGVDTATGKELWSFPWETANDVNAATPLVIGNSIFIASGYGHGCALVEVKGGQATQRWQNRAIQAHFSSPVYHDGRIYGTGDPGVLVCLNPADGAVLWRQMGFEKGGIMAVDGVILGNNGSNGDLIMVKLDPTSYQETGRISPLKGQAWTAPILVDKKAIVRTKNAIAVVDLS